MMATLFHLLNLEMERPRLYGWFHLMCFALAFVAAAWLCRRRHSHAQVRRTVFLTALLVLALEIYKHVVYHLSYSAEAGLQVNIQWYIFPWQFCSTPMYAGLLAAGHTFNMFFISPYCEPSLPVYSLVQAHVPYPWCLIIYILVFTLAAYLVLLTAMAISRLGAPRGTKRPVSA